MSLNASLAVATVPRIAKILLRDFRAFPGNETYAFDLTSEGKNLLLFGENGSGKSSLFHALRTLLNQQPPLEPFEEHRHEFTKGNEGTVTITMTSGQPDDYIWGFGTGHPANSGGGVPFLEIARRATFLDYKALLKTNFLHESADHVNLFALLVHSLLRDAEFPDGRTVLQHWNEVSRLQPKELPSRDSDEEVEEFETPEEQVNALAKAFRDQLNDLLNDPKIGIVTRTNSLLAKLVTGLIMNLTVGDLKVTKLSKVPTSEAHEFADADIRLDCVFYGHPVSHPPIFLNESRLTAMALSLYLAGAEACTPTGGGIGTGRLLVLDDVLIGLDLSNRIPVLKLLQEEFKDWQIILMTYDRLWFDLAREYTEHTKTWAYLTLLEMPTVPGQPSRPRIESHGSLIEVAENHLTNGDLMAAAVYIRAAFEARIRNVCRDYGIKIAFKPDPKEVKADQLWKGIAARQKEREDAGQADFIDRRLLQDVETVRSTVLNRLSHASSPTLVKNEVEFALNTVKQLHNYEFKKI